MVLPNGMGRGSALNNFHSQQVPVQQPGGRDFAGQSSISPTPAPPSPHSTANANTTMKQSIKIEVPAKTDMTINLENMKISVSNKATDGMQLTIDLQENSKMEIDGTDTSQIGDPISTSTPKKINAPPKKIDTTFYRTYDSHIHSLHAPTPIRKLYFTKEEQESLENIFSEALKATPVTNPPKEYESLENPYDEDDYDDYYSEYDMSNCGINWSAEG